MLAAPFRLLGGISGALTGVGEMRSRMALMRMALDERREKIGSIQWRWRAIMVHVAIADSHLRTPGAAH